LFAGTQEECRIKFKNKARASWRRRTDEMKNFFYTRVRNMSHEKFMDQLRADHPGESKAVLRYRLHKVGGTVATSIVQALQGFSTRATAAVVVAFDHFEKDMAQAAGITLDEKNEIIAESVADTSG
jgi:hypothetical protein